MIEDGTGLIATGGPARATGLSVRTIRYRSDEGVRPRPRSARRPPEADAFLADLLGTGADRATVPRRIDLGQEVAR
ncbi:hypothetical protein ABZ079_30555 [Streptomyces sp. NPDC006314]|uniref:hypothetical protein n=1 Tax=Streptomyces sp. NPDC006314 TaxID=3154475 RepID=UPI00339DDC34